MGLNKKTVDDINVKGKRVLVRCDFNVPLKEGKITDRVIRQVDVAPTIAEILDVRKPEQCEGAPVYQILKK